MQTLDNHHHTFNPFSHIEHPASSIRHHYLITIIPGISDKNCIFARKTLIVQAEQL